MVSMNMHVIDAPVEKCVHSRFNTRKTRREADIDRLAQRIERNGFERTRSLWAVERADSYEVFAGGTRLEAARRAGLESVPTFVFKNLADEQIARKADEDNENDEYHTPVGLLDVWAECHRLYADEGWPQQRIADAKHEKQQTISLRIRLHDTLPDVVRKAVTDELLDEGHCEAIIGVLQDIGKLQPWLTTAQAQSELATEVLSRHTGTSVGVKPSVKVVREAAKRWKSLIQAAQDAYRSLPEGPWRERFVEILAAEKARTEAAVTRALGQVVALKRRQEEDEATQLRAEADAKQREAQRLRHEQRRLAYLESQTAKLHLGDARELIAKAPQGFHLLLTDPPYGMDFQSNRRVATKKKDKIANDGKQEALDLLADVLGKSYARMAEDATCLIFTGWRYEPEFRQIIETAGFTIKGSLVWVKNNHGSGDLAGSFAPKHERILHAVKGRPRLQRRAPDVLHSQDKPRSDHPNEKPGDLLRQLIEVTTEPGHIVVDPFFGSGNTVVEAYGTGRDFFGIELESRWHQAAVDRIHKMAERQGADGSVAR